MKTTAKGLAVAAVGLGVLTAGGLLGPDVRSAADSGWQKEPDSVAQRYTGAGPSQEEVLEDFTSATASTDVGPALPGTGIMNASQCAAVRNYSGLTAGGDLASILARLADRGWTVEQRRTAPPAVSLSKGSWKLILTPEPPGGTPYLSFVAIRGTTACEEELAPS
ncbi:hypothetical protein ABZ891_38740 [Streptomyces sp. NPDC047023]|uniref:hypothetical protein n=1 Tax=Streptomyces sp. NPDC047023 TaxID=3155139 RepID=UPI0033E1FC91